MLPIGIPAAASEPRAACILDVRLALGPHGLRSAAGLSRLADVWFPGAVHALLREPRVHAGVAGALVPSPYAASVRALEPEAERAGVLEALDLWDRAPADADLAALPLFHLGDRADECRAPPHADRSLRDRCEQLTRGLDLRVLASGYDLPRGAAVAECFRDALALCAALAAYGAFVLTRLERDGQGAPAICDYADAWGLGVRRVTRSTSRAAAMVGALVARAGLEPVAWAGPRLACVHVLAAGLPVLGGSDPRLDDEGVARGWGGAEVFWHEV